MLMKRELAAVKYVLDGLIVDGIFEYFTEFFILFVLPGIFKLWKNGAQ